MKDPTERLIFDQYSRYRSTAEIVSELCGSSAASILDVGSGELGLLGQFLPAANITYVDPLLDSVDAEDDRHIGGDVFTSKLNNKTFDYLVSVDTLEHVPADFRSEFLTRISELGTQGLVLAFPCSDAGDAVGTDEHISRLYQEIFGREYSWLDEHFRYELPSLEQTLDQLRALGWYCQVIEHGHTPWLRELLGFVVCAWDIPEAHEIVLDVSEYFNRELYPFDFSAPAYRQIVVATREPRTLEPCTHRLPVDDEAREKFENLMETAYRRLLPLAVQLSKDNQAITADVLGEESPELMHQKCLAALKERDEVYQRCERALSERDLARAERDALATECDSYRTQLLRIQRSTSWRMTAPLRFVMRTARYGPQPADKEKLFSFARTAYRSLPLPRRVKAWLRAAFLRMFPSPLAPVNGIKVLRKPGDFDTDPEYVNVLLAARESGLPDYLVFGVIDWHFRTQRPQHLARELAQTGRRVFYVSNLFEHGQEPGFSVEPLDQDGRLFQIRLYMGSESSIYAGAPGIQEIAQLRTSMGEVLLWTKSDNLVALVQHPYWFDLASVLPNAKLVYDCMDHHEGFDNTGAELLDLERTLATQSDLLIVTSSLLDESWADLNGNRAVIRNAGDYEHFSTTPERCYRDEQGRQVIGYYGAIAEWFDLDLVEAVATKFMDCQVLLIGADTTHAERRLSRLQNVTFTGEVPYQQLPYYLHGFDACILPFKVVPLTLATNPVKVYEYLSAGKPVVSVDLPELAQFEGLVRVANSREDFLEQIRLALDEGKNSPQQLERMQFASGQTWAHRVSDLVAHSEAPAKEPTISVVVVTYNNLELNKACLESLAVNSSYENLEVIVVDNASIDGTPEMLREWADGERRRIILNDENKGFAAANNQGLEASGGDYLVMLNNDTYVTPGWVRTLMNHLRRDSTIGLLGPVTNNIGNEARIDIKYDSMSEMVSMASRYTRRNLGKLFGLRTAAFFCVMMPRSVYEKVGPLDEAFGIGWFEDDDYCRRAEQLGWRIVCAEDVFVHHHHSATFDKLKQKERQALFEKNKEIYEEKWGAWIPHTYR